MTINKSELAKEQTAPKALSLDKVLKAVQSSSKKFFSTNIEKKALQFQTLDQFVWALEFDLKWRKELEKKAGYADFFKACAEFIERDQTLQSIYTPQWWADKILQHKWVNEVYLSPIFKGICVGAVVLAIVISIVVPILFPVLSIGGFLAGSIMVAIMCVPPPGLLAAVWFRDKECMEEFAFKNFYERKIDVSARENVEAKPLTDLIDNQPEAYLKARREEKSMSNYFFSLFHTKKEKLLNDSFSEIPHLGSIS